MQNNSVLLDRFLARLEKVQNSNGTGQYTALCPSHQDKERSLSVAEGEKGLVIKCFAGCETKEILQSLGLDWRDIWAEKDDNYQTQNITKKTGKKKKNHLYIWEEKAQKISAAKVKTWLIDQRHFTPATASEIAGNVAAVAKYNKYQGDKIVFPIWGDVKKKNIVGVQSLDLDNRKEKKIHGTSKGFFGLGTASPEIFIVESIANALALYSAGYNAITIFSTSNLKQIPKLSSMFGAENIYLWLDKGEEDKANDAREMYKIKVVYFGDDDKPKGYDVNDLLVDSGDLFREKVSELIIESPQKKIISKRLRIVVEGGNMSSEATEAESALLASEKHNIYQRSGVMVRVIKGAEKPKGIRRDDGVLSIINVEIPYLLEAITDSARLLKLDERNLIHKPINCPKYIAETLMARACWRFPVLTGVIYAPTLRPDGSIFQTPGYDTETGFLFIPGKNKFPPIPENPTHTEAVEAIKKISTLIKKFPFVEDMDKSVTLAAILTCVIRRSISTAPIFGNTAPKMGSGKTLLVDVASLVATGRKTTKISQAKTQEETEKRLLAVLAEGDSVVCIDNIDYPLESDSLCTILTEETWKSRELGKSRMVRVNTNATWFATGNNLTFKGDLTSRALLCSLDAKCERPEEREFDVNLKDYLRENWIEYMVAAITVLRAYQVAGAPSQNVKQYGRFEEWSRKVREAIIWCGMPDPCDTRQKIEASDPHREQLTDILESWHDYYGDDAKTLRDVKRDLGTEEAFSPEEERINFYESVMSIAGKKGFFNSSTLGYYLRKNKNRIENGLSFRQGEKTKNGMTWKVEKNTQIRRESVWLAHQEYSGSKS